MSTIVKIDSIEVGGEIRPAIPFAGFPFGVREAKPDPDNGGKLAWFVTLPDPEPEPAPEPELYP